MHFSAAVVSQVKHLMLKHSDKMPVEYYASLAFCKLICSLESMLDGSIPMSWGSPLSSIQGKFFRRGKKAIRAQSLFNSMAVAVSTEGFGRLLWKQTTAPHMMFLLLLLLSSQSVASNNKSQCFGVVCQGLIKRDIQRTGYIVQLI